jgi:hypothetical protein
VERPPPSGPEGGEPFPTFDPEFPTPPAKARATGGRPPTRPQTQAAPWLVGLAVAAVTVTISIIAFGLLGPSSTPVAGPTTTTTEPTDNNGTGPGNGTDPGNGTQVTLPGGTDPPPIEPTGSPIPVEELQMRANGIGPFAFGASGDEVLGRFAATFGTPVDTGFIVGSGSWGECPGDSIRVVRWGPLNLVVRGEPGNNQFVSYRMDLRHGSVTSEVTDMATLSGLRVGDTVERLRSIYADFDIVFVVDQVVDLVFELRESSDGDVLLWGPVESQSDSGRVNGIYSPDPC